MAYCKEVFQPCYDQSKENEVIVTKCDANPEVNQDEIKVVETEIKKETEEIMNDPEVQELLEESFDPSEFMEEIEEYNAESK